MVKKTVIKSTSWFINSRYFWWCSTSFRLKKFYCLKSWGRSGGVKIWKRNFAETPLSWDMSRDVKKLRKLRYHQKLLAWPLNQGIWQKVCYKVNLLKNNGNKNNGPQNTLNMSWNCPNWEQLRAVVYSVNLYHHIHITQHKKALVRVTIKISGCLRWFVNKSSFADEP